MVRVPRGIESPRLLKDEMHGQRDAGPCCFAWARGFARLALFSLPQNEGDGAPRRRSRLPGHCRTGYRLVTHIVADVRRASRRATAAFRQFAFYGSRTAGRPGSAPTRFCSESRPGTRLRIAPGGAASRPTQTTPRVDAPQWTGRLTYKPAAGTLQEQNVRAVNFACGESSHPWPDCWASPADDRSVTAITGPRHDSPYAAVVDCIPVNAPCTRSPNERSTRHQVLAARRHPPHAPAQRCRQPINGRDPPR